MTLETQIINYLRDESNGKIDLSTRQAKRIVELITNPVLNVSAYAKISRFSGVTNTYEPYRTVKTTDAMVKAAIVEALKKDPAMQFYKYE